MKEKIIDLFYRIGASRTGRLASRRMQGDGAILMYHRILPDVEAAMDPAAISVGVTMFEKQMQLLTSQYHCVSMSDLPSAIRGKQASPRAFPVAVTFDDGYADNLTYALPILKKYKVPATIYCVNRFLHGDGQMWWYELDEILRQKKSLNFRFGGTRYSWEKIDSHQSRKRYYKILREMFVRASSEKQSELLAELRGPSPIANYIDNCLNQEEVVRLANEPLITIGGHTYSHSVLSRQPLPTLEFETSSAASELGEIVGKPIEHFAYPFGTLNEAGEREYLHAARCGFSTAVTTLCFPLRAETSRWWSLPRHAVKARTQPKHLQAKLSGWNAAWNGVQF